jgi:hypothetical protein
MANQKTFGFRNYYLIPSIALGPATVNVMGANRIYTGTLQVSNVAPAIFSANTSGLGVAAAQIIRVSASGQITTQMIYQPIFQPWVVFGYVPLPIHPVAKHRQRLSDPLRHGHSQSQRQPTASTCRCYSPARIPRCLASIRSIWALCLNTGGNGQTGFEHRRSV